MMMIVDVVWRATRKMRYKMINKKEAEGKEVQYAGIYILKLRDSDMQPDCYFVEDDD